MKCKTEVNFFNPSTSYKSGGVEAEIGHVCLDKMGIHQPDKLLTQCMVYKTYLNVSRSTWYNLRSTTSIYFDQDLPAPKLIGKKCLRWSEQEILTYITKKSLSPLSKEHV